jgi:hypothetical protein
LLRPLVGFRDEALGKLTGIRKFASS